MAKSKQGSVAVKEQAAKLKELAEGIATVATNLQAEIENSKDLGLYEPIENLAVFVRQIRKKQKVSLQVLAALSGVSLGTIQALEKGKKTMSLENTTKILNALGKKLWVF